MSSIPIAVTKRLTSAVPKFKKILEKAKERDVNEPDTVTITVIANNNDQNLDNNELHRVILPELAHTIADSTVGAIAQRLEQARNGGSLRSATIGGQSTLSTAMATHVQALVEQSRDMKEILNGSDFVLPLNMAGSEGAGSIGRVLWVRVEHRNFNSAGNLFDYDGDLFSGQIGADTHLGDDMLAGMGLFWSEGDANFKSSQNSDSGNYKLDLLSVHLIEMRAHEYLSKLYLC